jgi:hypothetical protein
MRPYRDISTVAALEIVCFSVLAHFEPQFFLLHLYQTIIYVALLILLFYMEDRWAYMIGMLASIAWLAMVFATGLLGGAARQALRIMRGQAVTNDVSFIADSFLRAALEARIRRAWQNCHHLRD